MAQTTGKVGKSVAKVIVKAVEKPVLVSEAFNRVQSNYTSAEPSEEFIRGNEAMLLSESKSMLPLLKMWDKFCYPSNARIGSRL